MPLLRRVTDEQASDFRPIPEGLWRFRLGKPELKHSERYDNWRAKFPLLLPDDEQERLIREHGRPPLGIQQSTLTSYFTGLSLGYRKRSGEYTSTRLVDFLAPTLGAANERRFREWIIAGGGPPRPDDIDDQKAELELIEQWLTWFEDMEVYGSIRHEEDKEQAGVIWARFGGPMAIGSLPGQKEDAYQALGRGKLRSMVAEWQGNTTARPAPRLAESDTATQLRAEIDAARARVATPARSPTPAPEEPDDDDIPF